MDWYWCALVGVAVVAWYVAVGRWIAHDLRKKREKPYELHYFIWILSPIFAAFLIPWYAGWLLSGGLIPPPHETMNEGE